MIANQPLVHFIPRMFLTAPDETDDLQTLNTILCQVPFPMNLTLGHHLSGQFWVLRPTVRHLAVVVYLSVVDKVTIPALTPIFVPIKLKPQTP